MLVEECRIRLTLPRLCLPCVAELRQLPQDVCREYEEAMQMDPSLVHRESNVVDILRGHNNNPTRAASDIARYWKARKAVFGEDRWLRPMDQVRKT